MVILAVCTVAALAAGPTQRLGLDGIWATPDNAHALLIAGTRGSEVRFDQYVGISRLRVAPNGEYVGAWIRDREPRSPIEYTAGSGGGTDEDRRANEYRFQARREADGRPIELFATYWLHGKATAEWGSVIQRIGTISQVAFAGTYFDEASGTGVMLTTQIGSNGRVTSESRLYASGRTYQLRAPSSDAGALIGTVRFHVHDMRSGANVGSGTFGWYPTAGVVGQLREGRTVPTDRILLSIRFTSEGRVRLATVPRWSGEMVHADTAGVLNCDGSAAADFPN